MSVCASNKPVHTVLLGVVCVVKVTVIVLEFLHVG